MYLPDQIKAIQRAVGVDPDGSFGPRTAQAVLNALSVHDHALPHVDDVLDARTLDTIQTLDPKARDRFVQFALKAKATAATFNCDYVAIKGNRTWAEQDALYAKGRTAPGKVVTNARGGQSNHNFGIAVDFGVFRRGVYVDDADPDFADKVHKACSLNAAGCGLDWGGSWHSIQDTPHYEVGTGLTLAQKRDLYQAKGSVLS